MLVDAVVEVAHPDGVVLRGELAHGAAEARAAQYVAHVLVALDHLVLVRGQVGVDEAQRRVAQLHRESDPTLVLTDA